MAIKERIRLSAVTGDEMQAEKDECKTSTSISNSNSNNVNNSNNGTSTDRPRYGLRLYPQRTWKRYKPKKSATVEQTIAMLPAFLRYLVYYCKLKFLRKKPIMDFIKMKTSKQIYGCPIGGIGTGTIGRGFKGEFCRFSLRPGMYNHDVVPENQFIINIRNEANETIYQSVLSANNKPNSAPSSWEWKLNGSDCEYIALYPRAWTFYDFNKFGVEVSCRQISPIIPHNYKDTSLPCAVFVWNIKNTCSSTRSVSITFTFKKICLTSKDKKENMAINFERYCDNTTGGITMEQTIDKMPCAITLAKTKNANDLITEGFCKFNTKKTASDVWHCLESKGNIMPGEIPVSKCPANAMALCSHTTIEPGRNENFEFCLVWDMPTVNFRNNTKLYNRYYTKFFGNECIAGPSIASYALASYKSWELDIEEWQKPILENESLPDWYKSAIMNELYYISDGGTVWFDGSELFSKDDPRHTYGLFGYLEGHEYRMYNTYDVHFYASFALIQLWPRLQISLQYQFNETICKETKSTRKHLFDGVNSKRKSENSVPHDLGDPEEEPFEHINAYNVHDVCEWRDLNLKFILQVFRDYTILNKNKCASNNMNLIERYDSLKYIDDFSDTEEDLYIRSTNQIFNSKQDMAILIKASLSNTMKKQINGNCRKQREKHVSISSNDEMPMNKIHNYIRQNSCGKPFPFQSQISQCSENLIETTILEDVVDGNGFLKKMYPSCRLLIDRILTWDKDGDGLIENSGFADQTFDAWVMTGPSAYCGGLWLASIQCMLAMATIQDIQDDVMFFSKLLAKAKLSFEEKLWNGKYYNFDINHKAIMADQLCGHWYLRACGFQYQVFPKDHVQSALKMIYENNVLRFGNGLIGAVNGYIPTFYDKEGHVDSSSIQSVECWVGVTYALASLMLFEGMTEQAFKTAGGLNQTLIHEMGMAFETPEAVYENYQYRSIGYMRPLSIWAMQLAIDSKPNLKM